MVNQHNPEIFAVIGANYGDEGKGLVTCALCREANRSDKSVLNILTNGGCQRGHTAYDSMGRKHIYSHLGSGYPYSDIYFSKYYMVNPMVFMNEYTQYQDQTDNQYSNHKIYIDSECTITLPYDMLVNRMVENRRSNRHGSCGYGIWETVRRNKITPLYIKHLSLCNFDTLHSTIRDIRDTYYPKILEEYDIKMTKDEQELFYSDTLLRNYAEDLVKMLEMVKIISYDSLRIIYDTIVFENAQGLLLDMDVDNWGTPSKTGMDYIRDIESSESSITPIYVTRSYLTKHGNGLFPEVCLKEEINATMIDLTNMPNPYQGTLRYGKFSEDSIQELLDRIKKDARDLNYKLVVTHTNEFFDYNLIKYADYVSDNEISISNRIWW